MNKKEFTPFVATHPGEMIKDELKERGMTQKQLADETGIKTSVLSETINGKRSVSLNVALALEKSLNIPADVWMNMQTQYDLDTANNAERDNQRETVAVTIPMRDRNLLQELVRKFGWACVFCVISDPTLIHLPSAFILHPSSISKISVIRVPLIPPPLRHKQI